MVCLLTKSSLTALAHIKSFLVHLLLDSSALPAAAFLYRLGKVPTTIRPMNDYSRERFTATEKEAEFTSTVDFASEHC